MEPNLHGDGEPVLDGVGDRRPAGRHPDVLVVGGSEGVEDVEDAVVDGSQVGLAGLDADLGGHGRLEQVVEVGDLGPVVADHGLVGVDGDLDEAPVPGLGGDRANRFRPQAGLVDGRIVEGGGGGEGGGEWRHLEEGRRLERSQQDVEQVDVEDARVVEGQHGEPRNPWFGPGPDRKVGE